MRNETDGLEVYLYEDPTKKLSEYPEDMETEEEQLDFWYDEVLCNMDDDEKGEVYDD